MQKRYPPRPLLMGPAFLMLSLTTAGVLYAAAPSVYPTPMDNNSYTIPFKTAGQQLRNTPPGSFSFTLMDEGWNSGTKKIDLLTNGKEVIDSLGFDGDVVDWLVDELDPEEIELGAEVSASSSGRAAFTFRLNDLTHGTVDVGYPIDVDVQLPKPNTFRGGDTVVIRTAYDAAAGVYMRSTPEGGSMSVDTNLGLSTNAGVKVCAGDCTSQTLVNLNVPDDTRTLFTLGSAIDGNVLPDTPLCDPLQPGEYSRWNITFCETYFHGISGYAGFPMLETDTPSKYADGSLHDSMSYTFTDLKLDIDSYLKYAGLPIPLGLKSPTIQGVQVGYETIDYAFNVDISQRRDIAFTPNPKVTIVFDTPMDYTVLDGATESTVIDQGHGTSATFKVGQSLALAIPQDRKEPIAAGHTYVMKNSFSHKGSMTFNSDYTNTAMAISFNTPSFQIFGGAHVCLFGHYEFPCKKTVEICDPTGILGCYDQCVEWGTKWVCDVSADIPKIQYPGTAVNLGPLVTASLPFPQVVDHIFPKTTFELKGFDTYTASGLALDPEDPVIAVQKELVNAANNGSGSQRVTFAMSISNDGDVPLAQSQITDLLSETFAGAEGFSVEQLHSCTEDLVNPDYDGTALSPGLINARTLNIGEEWFITLITDVKPAAYAPPYINTASAEGTSIPRGTTVSQNASASVALGPVAIETLEQYALFATHKVMLDTIGDSQGTIGSNDTIQINNGNGGVLAGELRAMGDIRVKGDMSVDYAFTNTYVYENGKGELHEIYGKLENGDFTGEMAQYQPVPQELPLFAFTASDNNVTAAADTNVTLLPGTYGTVTVQSGAILTLDNSGDYTLEGLVVENNATVALHLIGDADTPMAPLTLNIVSRLVVGGNAHMHIAPAAASTRDVRINVKEAEHVTVGENAQLQGVITAPLSKLTLRDNSRLDGAAYARFISMESGSRVFYHQDRQGELYKRIDLNCDGIADIMQ